MRPWTPARGAFIDRLDGAQLWATVRARRWWIVGLGIAAIFVVAAVTAFGRMQFRSHGSLYLGDLQEKGTAGPAQPDQFNLFGARSGDVGTEMEILRSRALLTRAVRDAGLNATLVSVENPPLRYWQWRLEKRPLEALDPVSRHLLARDANLDDDAVEPRKLVVTMERDAAYALSTPDGRAIAHGRLGAPMNVDGFHLTLLAGPEGPPAPGRRYRLTIANLADVVDHVGRFLSVGTPKTATPGEQIKVVAISFLDRSPQMAARFVSALMRAYLERRQTWKSDEATAAETFVGERLEDLKASVDEAEQELADYRKGSQVVVLGNETRAMLDQISKYEEQRVAAKLQVATFNKIDSSLHRKDSPIEESLVGETEDPVLAGLSTSLAQAEQELTRMQSRFTGDAPALQEQQAQVDRQIKMVKSYVTGRRARAQEQLESLNQLMAQFEDKLKTVPNAEQRLTQLTRNADVLSKMYSLLLERQQQATVVKASNMSKNHVLDAAEVPRHEDSPRLPLRFAAAGLLGLLIGTLSVVSRRLLAVTFQSEKEVRAELGVLPVFGALPDNGGRRAARGDRIRSSTDVFTVDAHSPFAEAFRHLRANIYYAPAGRGDKVFLFTSPNEGDGKTLSTLGLAVALAADHKRVLVVDGDLHRPSHHRLFQLVAQPGLSSVLTREMPWEKLVCTVETPYGTFDALPAGAIPPSPAELLSSPMFGALVAQAKRLYDFVLIDAPPFPMVSDALVISTSCDRVLSVLRLGNTQRRLAEEHLARFSAATHRYGVIINGVTPATRGHYGYGHPSMGGAQKGIVVASIAHDTNSVVGEAR